MRSALCLALIVSLIGFSLLLRVPFVSNLIMGEEGSHAYLVVGAKPVINSTAPQIVWEASDAFPNSYAYANLIARFDGKDVLGFMARNLMAYEFLDKGARRINQLLPVCPDTSVRCLSISSRLPFLVLFELGLLIGLIAVSRSFAFERPRTLALQVLAIAYLVSAPLIVGASIQPQIDGALGVLIVLSSAAMLLTADSSSSKGRLVAGFAAGVVGALVKNEWAISLSAATIFVTLVSLMAFIRTAAPERDPGGMRRALGFCLSVLLGIGVCQLLLFAYEPQAFLAGLSMIRQVAGDSRQSMVETLRHNWPLIYPVVAACVVLAGALSMRPLRYCVEKPSLAIVSTWALAIVAGYVLSGNLGDGFPRYYTPPAMLAALALTLLIPSLDVRRIVWLGSAAILTIGVLANLTDVVQSYRHRLSISAGRGQSLDATQRRYERDAQVARSQGATVMEGSAIGIYFHDIDWITSEAGLEGSIDMMRRFRPGPEAKLYVPELYLGWCKPELSQFVIGCPGSRAR